MYVSIRAVIPCIDISFMGFFFFLELEISTGFSGRTEIGQIINNL